MPRDYCTELYKLNRIQLNVWLFSKIVDCFKVLFYQGPRTSHMYLLSIFIHPTLITLNHYALSFVCTNSRYTKRCIPVVVTTKEMAANQNNGQMGLREAQWEHPLSPPHPNICCTPFTLMGMLCRLFSIPLPPFKADRLEESESH